MSQGPSTFGTMITSSLSPISGTRVRKSSSTHGLSSELTRVHSAVEPRSVSLATLTRPSRAASLRSAGIASSRLPSRTSVALTMSGTLATIFSFEASRKWIIRAGLTGISLKGCGASMASGWPNWRGFLKLAPGSDYEPGKLVAVFRLRLGQRAASRRVAFPTVRSISW